MNGEGPVVSSNGFQPFVPRVVSRRARATAEDRVEDGSAGRVIDAPPAPVTESARLAGPQPSGSMAASRQSDGVDSLTPEREVRCALHIRERAIELAGAACARALHA